MNNSLLAIETATSACSVALQTSAGLTQRVEVGSNVHSKVLLQMVGELLDEAGLSAKQLAAVAVGQGPGSFTGLRIGVGVAQGIAYGAGCPMIGISSLDALANQAENGHVISAVDARMGEVYWCEYKKNGIELERLSTLQVTKPGLIAPSFQSQEQVQILGNAWQEYQAEFSEDLLSRALASDEHIYPLASSLIVLARRAYERGELIDPIDFAPEYVRNDVAKKSLKVPPQR